LQPPPQPAVRSVRRGVAAALGSLALTACGGLIPAAQAPAPYSIASHDSSAKSDALNEPIRIGTGRDYPRAVRAGSRPSSSRQTLALRTAPMSRADHPGDRSCLAGLGNSGARFERVPDRYEAPGCNQLGTVRISALAGDGTQFAVSNLGPVKCATARAFGDWARFGVDRAARQILGSPLIRIKTMGSYACRNIAGKTLRSAHATGNAIDVSGFELADGRVIDLKSDWDGGTAREREFLRIVHKSACKRFGTVLGPEYDAAHRDHFHLEGTGSTFCS